MPEKVGVSMRKQFLLLPFLIILTSCEFIERKMTSEEILQEEIQALDWNDVDRFPLFDNCDENSSKTQQKECFVLTMNEYFYKVLDAPGMVATKEIRDTILVFLEVDNKGKFRIDKIEIDSLLQKEFPFLESELLKSVDSLRPVTPGYKRGIPVKTQFVLPIAIQTE